MNQRHHARQPSQGRKVAQPLARPSRPTIVTQRRSYNHAQTCANTSAHPSAHPSPKKAAGPGWSARAEGEDGCAMRDDDEESGMASFLQFCTTCERQIVTPNPSILYCSEACRRRDSRPPSLEEIQSIQQSLHSATLLVFPNTSFEHRAPDIVPQLSPTVPRHISRAFSDLSLGDELHDSSVDEHASRDLHRANDRTNYLQQFYSSFTPATRQQRPGTKRRSTTSTGTHSGGDISTNLPSLCHSPSSSYGTVASNASDRPVLKHHPFTSSFTTKNVELVLPHPMESTSPPQLLRDASLKSSASTLTSFRVAEANDISYEAPPTSGSTRPSRERADRTLEHLYRQSVGKASTRHE